MWKEWIRSPTLLQCGPLADMPGKSQCPCPWEHASCAEALPRWRPGGHSARLRGRASLQGWIPVWKRDKTKKFVEVKKVRRGKEKLHITNVCTIMSPQRKSKHITSQQQHIPPLPLRPSSGWGLSHWHAHPCAGRCPQ